MTLCGDTLIKESKLGYQKEAVASFQFSTRLGQPMTTQRNLHICARLLIYWFFKILIYLNSYIAGPKDMKEDDVQTETFKAKLKSFDQELMEEYNIEETRERAPTYIY